MKVEEVIKTQNHMFNLFLAVSPEIFIINATFILRIHGVVFSTSKKDEMNVELFHIDYKSYVSFYHAFSIAKLSFNKMI
jgi:hypothetical protein